MTPERKAELRKLAEQRRRFAALYGYDVDIFVVAIPELLDELEALTAEAAAHRKALSDICTAVVPSAEDGEYHVNEIIAAIMAGAESYARVDGLAAMAARLRDCLEFGRNNIDIVMRTLADTEAAATTWLEAHDREQRLAGARDAIERLRVAGQLSHSVDFSDLLEAMEREGQ